MLGFYWGRAAVRMRTGAGAAVYNRGEAPSLQQDWRGRGGGCGLQAAAVGARRLGLVCVCVRTGGEDIGTYLAWRAEESSWVFSGAVAMASGE